MTIQQLIAKYYARQDFLDKQLKLDLNLFEIALIKQQQVDLQHMIYDLEQLSIEVA